MPPTASDAGRRLLILLAVSGHALRLMMIWDCAFQTAVALRNLTGESPNWGSLGLRGEWLKLRAHWSWFWERRAIRRALGRLGLFSYVTLQEQEFFRLGLSERSRGKANALQWQIEAASCLAWALRLLPRLWPMDESFDGKLDFVTLAAPERRLIESATLRPFEEIQAAAERVKLWHWRGRQLKLERQGCSWPPQDATPEQVADLQSKGMDTLDGIVRVTVRLLRDKGEVVDTVDEDFVAKGKAYRHLSEDELSELLGIAAERHLALNWLCGCAPDNDWAAVPTET